MNNMRRGFTMIELIFVIVIIGILAAVAIPKLAANKDDATAKTCEHEIGQFISEVGGAYTASTNFADWQTKVISDVTNITSNVGAAGSKGIQEAPTTVVDATPINYNCDGELVATMTAATIAGSNDYALTVQLSAAAAGPAAKKVVADLTTQYGGVNNKVFNF